MMLQVSLSKEQTEWFQSLYDEWDTKSEQEAMDYFENLKKAFMDKKIKKLQKNTKSLMKEESSLLKEDKKHDKVIDKAKNKMKGKC